jgi:cytochrome P460
MPDTLIGLGCMVKDTKRFADSGDWGYAQFDYDAASATFKPNASIQANDAKCGVACHTIVKAKDFVFTAYPAR